MIRRVLVLFLLLLCIPTKGFSKSLAGFEGFLDLVQNRLSGVIELGEQHRFKMDVTKMTEGLYQFAVGIEHLSFLGRDITSALNGYVERVTDAYDEVVYVGRVGSKYSLIDYQPVDELEVDFQIRKKILQIISLKFGRWSASGVVELMPPFRMDIEMKVDKVSLADFIQLWLAGVRYDAAGEVQGDIKISGDIQQLFLKGDLTVASGYAGRVDFGSLQVALMGYYPNLQISNSRVITTDGLIYSISGAVDLSKRGQIVKQIKALTFAPVILNSERGSEWTLKQSTAVDDGASWKYIIRSDSSRRNLDSRDGGVLGIEQRMEF